MPKMYLVCGPSGCGKTTFSKRLAEREGLIHFTPDAFYALVNGDDRIRDHLFEAWSALFLAIHMAEKNGKDCVVDTNALTLVQRGQFLDWFPGFEHHLIYIEADEALLRKNNASRRREIPDEKMAQIIRELRPVTPDEDERWASISFWRNTDNEFTRIWKQERGETR